MKYLILFITFSTLVLAQEVVLVHGLNNNGTIFNGTKVEQAVNLSFSNPFILKPSMGGNLPANTQSNNLKNALTYYNFNDALSISYSMGGIVTRNYIKSNNANNRLNGHISIGAPHRGAKLANNAEIAFSSNR